MVAGRAQLATLRPCGPTKGIRPKSSPFGLPPGRSIAVVAANPSSPSGQARGACRRESLPAFIGGAGEVRDRCHEPVLTRDIRAFVVKESAGMSRAECLDEPPQGCHALARREPCSGTSHIGLDQPGLTTTQVMPCGLRSIAALRMTDPAILGEAPTLLPVAIIKSAAAGLSYLDRERQKHRPDSRSSSVAHASPSGVASWLNRLVQHGCGIRVSYTPKSRRPTLSGYRPSWKQWPVPLSGSRFMVSIRLIIYSIH